MFQVLTTLNTAMLLPDRDLEVPLRDCSKILARVHRARPYLQGTPLPDAEVT